MNFQQKNQAAADDLVEKIILIRSMDGYTEVTERVMLINLFDGMRFHLVRQGKPIALATSAVKAFFYAADSQLVQETGRGMICLPCS